MCFYSNSTEELISLLTCLMSLYYREEAIHCPKVVVADLDPSVYKNRQTVKAQVVL